jgi:uncharacterized protein (DUF4415 family)
MDNDTQRFTSDEAANRSASKGFAGLIGSVASVRNERAALTAKPESEIDFSDLPATQRKDWQGAERGKFYRTIEQQLTVRVDADVLEWRKSQGSGYPSRLSDSLLKRHAKYVAERPRRRHGRRPLR